MVIKNLWVFVILFFVRKDKIESWIIVLAIIAGLLILIVSAVLQYYHFKYYIDEENEEFVIHEGIINTSVIKIKKENIQEVNISQPFVHRFFNIYKLEIDTPGSSEKEVKISALTKQNAIDLKKYLLTEVKVENSVHEGAEIAENQDANTLRSIKISTLSILKYGITANYVRSFFALVSLMIYGFSELTNLLKKAKLDTQLDYDTVESKFLAFSIPVILGIVLVVIVLGILINTVRTLIKFFNFKISENNQSFLLNTAYLIPETRLSTNRKYRLLLKHKTGFRRK